MRVRAHTLRRMTQLELTFVSMRKQSPSAGSDWFRIVTDKKSDVSKVYIYDEIGYWGTTAKDFAALLNDIEESTIELHLNSPGGSVFDGLAIMAALRSHKAKVIGYVDGMAASAASFILQAADERLIGRNAQIMIHDAKAYAGGNAGQMRKAADLLDRVSDNIADIYAVRSGQGTQQSWRAIMVAGDEWYNGNEAKDAGLVDEVLDNPDEDEDDEATENVWSPEEVMAFFQTPVEKLVASIDRPTRTNHVNEETHMTGTNPTNQPTAVPAPPAPVAPEASTQQQNQPVPPVVIPEALSGFVNNGTLDMVAVANELTTLRGFRKETIETGRKNFVKNLVDSGKIMADAATVENAEKFVLSLSNEQFVQYQASMTSAPGNSLFAQHGAPGGTTGPTATAAQAALTEIDDKISVAEGIVNGHRESGLTEDEIKNKQSYKDLENLREQRKQLVSGS